MATTITFNLPSDDETKPIIQTQTDQQYLLRPPGKIFKPFPSTIKQSIETNRQQLHMTGSHSTIGFLPVKRASIDTTADLDENHLLTISEENQPLSIRRAPSEIRVTLFPDEKLTSSQLEVSESIPEKSLRLSDPSLANPKSLKINRNDYGRRSIFDHRFGRRIHSSFSSSTTLRSLSRRRSTTPQSLLPPRLNLNNISTISRSRRHTYRLPRNSKWHIVRHRLHDIAMMSDSYARNKLLEQDIRWAQLREKICAQVFDMREMSLLRQQDDGLIPKKKIRKTRFDLKTIPVNELIHVERDGRVYSMSTRDLVLGRLLGDEDIHLDAFAQLDARRHLQVQQRLLKQQEGRTRLKKHIAFSFCLCNLSFIALMFAAMFIFAMKTIIELRSREFF